MNYDWQMDLTPRSCTAATSQPPALVEETPWDILLALHADEGRKLGLARLAAVVSAPQPVLNHWLALLEQRHLITGSRNEFEHEVRAVLTPAGRELLGRYLSVASDLQVGASQ